MNVQVKPHSGHDPKVFKRIFTRFLYRAYTICEGQHCEEEVNFLVRCFCENVYTHGELHNITLLRQITPSSCQISEPVT